MASSSYHTQIQPVACCPFSLKPTAIQISLSLGKIEAITQALSDGEMGKEYRRIKLVEIKETYKKLKNLYK